VADRPVDRQREFVMKLIREFPTLSVRHICELLGVRRTTLRYRPVPPDDDSTLRDAIDRLARQWPTYGYRRITKMLHRDGEKINVKRVRRLMAEMELLAEPSPRRVRTTNSNHDFPRFENLVKDLEIQAPEQVWVADITYVQLPKETVYLAIIMDVFTRYIRGWHLDRTLETGLALAALDRALRCGVPQIHHSDQGVQYASTAYVRRLTDNGVSVSMAAVGEPRENGYAERLMRTIKEEEVTLREYADYADAKRNLGRFIDRVYNRKRIHSSLGYLTPEEFETQWRQSRRVVK
jgi:transposase InsO family protein